MRPKPERSISGLKKPQILKKFVVGGLAGGSATICIQPLQRLIQFYKTKINKDKYFFNIKSTIIKNGPSVLYKSMGTPFIHNTLFTSIRFGVYSTLHDLYKIKYKENPSFLSRMVLGSAASTSSLVIGGPSDTIYSIINERNGCVNGSGTGSGKKDIINRVRYKIQKEGYFSLWRPQHGRTTSNLVQLAAYSESKHHLKDIFQMKENTNLYFLAGLISGVAKGCVRIPVKYLELHLHKLHSNRNNVSYLGLILEKIDSNEFLIFRRHLYWNMGQTVLTFVFLEELSNFYLDNLPGAVSSGL